MMNIKCFLIVKNGFTRRSLRRYVSSSKCTCCGPMGYHNAEVEIDKGLIGEPSTDIISEKEKNDPRWPRHCECGYEFQQEDEWMLMVEPEYARQDNFEVTMTLKDAPVGAIWRCEWYEDMPDMRGVDGKSYCVRTPGGDWVIDSRASNCTRPNDSTHKCWLRHGEAPNFTVDKNGDTCSAGAGSILMRNYHGFLRNGELTDC